MDRFRTRTQLPAAVARHPKTQSVARGHTLLEMMLSMVLLTVVMASVTSAVIFASSAKPDEASAESTLTSDSQALAQIAEDLSLARYVIEQNASSVTFIVGDRTGDGNPDRITYAWSGTRGDPLTYQLNDESAIELIDAVSVFDLTYTEQTQATAMPVATYQDVEKVLDAFTTVSSGRTAAVRVGDWYGQMLTLALSSNAIGFMPTKVDLYSEGKPPDNGTSLIQLRDRSSSAPGDTVYGAQTIIETDLSDTGAWNQFSLADTVFVPSDQTVSLTLQAVSGLNEVMEASEQNVSGIPGLGGGYGGHLSSTDGTNWSLNNGKTFVYRLYGREYLYDEQQYTVTQQRLENVKISVQSVADNRSPLTRSVRMMLSPIALDAFAETEFDSDPTGIDLDGDKADEWAHDSGVFPTTSISNGVWTANGQLVFSPSELSSADVITLSARLRSNDTLGPTVYGPYTINASRQLLPIQTQLRDDGNGGQELAIYNDTEMDSAYLVIPDLPSGFVDLTLTVIPDEDYLCVWVNHKPVAALVLDRVADPGTIDQAVRLGGSGGVAEFGSAYFKVGGTYAVGVASDEDVIGGVLDLLMK